MEFLPQVLAAKWTVPSKAESCFLGLRRVQFPAFLSLALALLVFWRAPIGRVEKFAPLKQVMADWVLVEVLLKRRPHPTLRLSFPAFLLASILFLAGSSTHHSSEDISCSTGPAGSSQGSCNVEPPLDTLTAALGVPLPTIQVSNLSDVLESHCALLCLPPCDPSTKSVLRQVKQVFLEDSIVFIGTLSNSTSVSIDIEWDASTWRDETTKVVFYDKTVLDRTCLLSPPRSRFKAMPYTGQVIPELLVQFVNEKCGTYRTISGALNVAGLFHSFIMTNLYHPEDMDVECPRLSHIPDQETFFQEFLFRSRPVVIENGAANWPAMEKWTMEYLRGLYGGKNIHIKLTEDGEFEGVESGTLWEGYRDNWIPESVRSQMQYPDLVVVRPATAEMTFSQFLDFITSRNRTHSAYLEYSSIPSHLPLLEQDIREMPFLKDLLSRRHLNIWLSDGNTLGKLHFDPFDNFLCQISGRKHLTLFDPHQNENLYEGHIPEAMLSVNLASGKFSRKRLLESTSMVMSPVDIALPDLQRFPRFARARRVRCSLGPGDVLFMPAFWWHEVQSYPDEEERRNLAVNFWYEPLLTKEFPCSKCRLQFNNFYRQFLFSPPI